MLHYLKKWVPGGRMTLAVVILSICALSGFAQCVSPGTVINFSNTGDNASAGYTTVYVLTDNAGSILQEVSSGFSAPSAGGDYKVYAVNYDTGGTAPTLSAGTDITAIGGTCAVYSSDPLLFCVAGTSSCVTTGATIAFSAAGQNTDPGFETMYVLTDSVDVITSSTNTSPIAAPSVEGTYKIYVVNYDTNNGSTAPTLAAGTPITAIGGTCAAISASPLVVCVAKPLPVTLVLFTAAEEGNAIHLKWETTEETNASHFEIQRSADARTWNPIGSKDATGESKSTITYSYTDSVPLSGTNYYRLKMIDNDETFAYSRIQNVKIDTDLMVLYPNPVSDVLFLKGFNANTTAQVSLHNAKGQVVFASSSVSDSGINIKNLPAGIYMVRITEAGALHTHKVVICK